MQSSRKQTTKAPPLSTNIKRQRIRPAKVKTSGQGLSYRVSLETANITTNAAGTATGFSVIDPMYYLSRQIGVVASTFQFYKVKSFNLTWVPIVGATTGGVVRMAYSDNPEVIYKLFAGTYTSSDVLLLTQQSQYNRRAPLWQETTFQCPNQVMQRRPKFSIDQTASSGAEVCDRVSQAVAIVQWSGPVSTAIGYLALDFWIEFMEPIPITSSPLFLSDTDRKKDCAEFPQYEPAHEPV